MNGKARSIALWLWAAAPLIAWAVYVGVGWALAPQLCGRPVVLHMVSAVFAGIAVAGAAMAWVRFRRGEGSPGGSHLGMELALKLGVLFSAGLVLAWVLAAAWCPA